MDYFEMMDKFLQKGLTPVQAAEAAQQQMKSNADRDERNVKRTAEQADNEAKVKLADLEVEKQVGSRRSREETQT